MDANAIDPTRATGNASGTVAQCTWSPNTTALIPSVTRKLIREYTNGKRKSDSTHATGPERRDHHPLKRSRYELLAHRHRRIERRLKDLDDDDPDRDIREVVLVADKRADMHQA